MFAQIGPAYFYTDIFTEIQVAEVNNRALLFNDTVLTCDQNEIAIQHRGSVADLFQTGRKKLTILLWILWFVAASGYYGVVLMSTELLNSNKDYCGHFELPHSQNIFQDVINNSSAYKDTCSLQCK